MASTKEETEVLSVSAAINRANKTLASLPLIIEGEVAEVNSKKGYKAVYFDVKDEHSLLSCMMWKNRYDASGVQLRVGAVVRLKGKLSVYPVTGRMSLDVSSISLAGEGDLRAQVDALARKLQAEGLTSPERKRPLPKYPEVIGLVTSPRGDAVHDVLRTLRRRYPSARVVFAGVPVEGPGAARNIVDGMMEVVNAGAEVCLIVRGGGSYESLMPYNDERLARTIARCPIPVVTGIGHEPDTTIADLVADVRASTPTGAAEEASPAPTEMRDIFEKAAQRMNGSMKRKIQEQNLKLAARADRPIFADPQSLLANWMIGLDIASDHLTRAIPGNVQRDQERLRVLSAQLKGLPLADLKSKADCVAFLTDRMNRGVNRKIDVAESELSQQAAVMESLSPLAVLGRGYSITHDAAGRVVSSADQVSEGDALSISLKQGSVDCVVTGTSAGSDKK